MSSEWPRVRRPQPKVLAPCGLHKAQDSARASGCSSRGPRDLEVFAPRLDDTGRRLSVQSLAREGLDSAKVSRDGGNRRHPGKGRRLAPRSTHQLIPRGLCHLFY